MLRFNSSTRSPVRNYFSRWEQWRLLVLVMSLGLVLFVMRELRLPENAEQVARVFTDDSVAAATDDVTREAQADVPARAEAEYSKLEVRPELLNVVKDNTYFRNAEKRAWFESIAVLQQASAEQVAASSIGEASYVQLADQPTAYRGKLVTVGGTVRQVTQQRPAENELGLKSYYRLVIQPRGDEIWPIFVYALELPEGFPLGEDVAVDVSASGFFFKNLSYSWRDGLGIAPVVLAKQVTISQREDAAQPLAAAPRTPIGAGSWNGASDASVPNAAPNVPALREVLALAGWDAERFAKLEDNQPLADDARVQLLELLWRVRTFDATSIEMWANTDLNIAQLIDDPASYRGEMVRVTGQLTRSERHDLSADDAARFELPAYFTCEIQTEQGRTIVVAAHVPEAWQRLESLDEPVSIAGVFVKRAPTSDGEPAALLVAKRVAWHPTAPHDGAVSFGESVLGSLGMDVGLLDDIRSRGVIRAEEREAFYALMQVAGRIGANQLARFAQGNLAAVRKHWETQARTTDDATLRALADEVLRRAADDRYSVAPLFNDPERQIGELFVMDGAARRVVRIDVETRRDGEGVSDVPGRFGFNHYYEMEVFTDDSQNYPLVFCVRELPAGLATGGDLHVPVRVAGFFFKDWLYRTRRTATNEPGDGAAAVARAQYAPLLIGRAPILLDVRPRESGVARWVGAGLFLLAFAGIWAAAWWFARDDRRFGDRARARFSLPEGQSLNELNVSSVDEPMK